MADQNALIGCLATFLCVVCYGTTFVTIKKFETRDGIFVSLMMSVGQLIPCLISSFAYSMPSVFRLAILSGVCYALANSCSIFIMERVGMAVGGLVWNVVTALTGWAVARFGLFGTPVQHPARNFVNIIGVVVLCLGALGLAVLCGFLYGNMPTPINYLLAEHGKGSMGLSPHSGAYMLSFAVGSILTSLFIFTAYSLLW